MFIIYSCLFQPVSVWWRQYRNHSCSCSRCCCCCHCRRCRLVDVCRCRCCGGRGRGCSHSRCRSLLLSLWLWLCLCLFLFLFLSFLFSFFFFLLLLLLEVEVGVGQVGKGNDISSDAVSSMSVILSHTYWTQKAANSLDLLQRFPTDCNKNSPFSSINIRPCPLAVPPVSREEPVGTIGTSAALQKPMTLQPGKSSTIETNRPALLPWWHWRDCKDQRNNRNMYQCICIPHFSGLLRCWLTPPNTTTHPWFCRTLVVSATVWNPRSSSGTTWHVIPTNYIHEPKTNRSPSLRVQNIHKLGRTGGSNMLGTASACTGPLELSITTTMTSTVFDLAEDFFLRMSFFLGFRPRARLIVVPSQNN